MPYTELTNVASYDALLTEIRDFLSATGDWTFHQNLTSPDEDSSPTAGGHQLVASNGDVLFGLRSTTSGPGANVLYLFDGVPAYSASAIDSLPNNSGNRYSLSDIGQAGGAGIRRLQQFAGPFPKAYLFTNDPSTYLHVVVEVQAGVFRHLMVGNAVKYGTWTGGGYYAATYWVSLADANDVDQPNNSASTVPFDSNGLTGIGWTLHFERTSLSPQTKWLAAEAASTFNGVKRRKGAGSFRGGWGRAIGNLRESLFSGLIPLAPVMLQYVQETDDPDTVHFVGSLPDTRMVNITNLAPADSILIGSDEYVCFPLVTKNGATDFYNTGVMGVAYKKHT
jgi:hypothetical protein